jgi:hypothetical protein
LRFAAVGGRPRVHVDPVAVNCPHDLLAEAQPQDVVRVLCEADGRVGDLEDAHRIDTI